jgi:hypothetical protein
MARRHSLGLGDNFLFYCTDWLSFHLPLGTWRKGTFLGHTWMHERPSMAFFVDLLGHRLDRGLNAH